ncbi:hypothetical protein E4U23_001447 [Claviceps purpurea]|nr:hypothetical protein E4U23_001447 [Claviceps purpurea]
MHWLGQPRHLAASFPKGGLELRNGSRARSGRNGPVRPCHEPTRTSIAFWRASTTSDSPKIAAIEDGLKT